MAWMPTVNFLELNKYLNKKYKELSINQNVNIFPRWMFQSTLSNKNKQSFRNHAYMIAGNVQRENKLGIAEGFPTQKLGKDDLITTKEVANSLGVTKGDIVTVEVSKTYFAAKIIHFLILLFHNYL